MIILDATTDTLELLTGSATSTDYIISWNDITTSSYTPGESNGNIASATTTTIVAAPAASTQRQINLITIVNRSTTASQTVTVKYDISGTERYLTPTVTILPGQAYSYTTTKGWRLLNTNGSLVTTTAEQAENRSDIVSVERRVSGSVNAVISTAEWAWKLRNTIASSPLGTFVPGTPGLSGRAITGGTSEAGCHVIPNSSGTGHILNYVSMTPDNGTQISGLHNMLVDLLWINSGIVVTTTTAQTITSVAFPARDINLSTNGDGLMIGLLIVTATTNGSIVTNCTVSYTNQAGTAGRTATCVGIGASAVAGDLYMFRLDAGDRGVRSIESITLGTSLVTGSVSLVVFKPLYYAGGQANAGTVTDQAGAGWLIQPNIFLPNDSAVVTLTSCISTTLSGVYTELRYTEI